MSININRIRGKELELLTFLDFLQPQIVAIQETKIDSSISTSELFSESCPYNVYRKDRTLDGGGVMLLIHKDISHMLITEQENDSQSVWVKVFANKTSHFVASLYHPPGGDLEKLDSQLKSLESQLEKIKDIHKGNKPPSVNILGDFLDIQSPDRLSDHDIVSGTLKKVISPIKKPRRKVYRYQKGEYESLRSDALRFAKEKRDFNGYSDTRSVQENFNLITSFIQDSTDKHIPSKLVVLSPQYLE